MPNHFLIIGLCGRDYKRLEATGKENFDFTPLVDANLCELVCKLPEELVGIIASTPLYRYQHKVTGERWTKNQNDPMIEVAEWERVSLTDDEVSELVGKYGAANWYDWQHQNWGTKWGTYNLKVHELGGDGSPVLIEFQTAWCQPTAEMMRKIDNYLCETYCLKNIRWIGHDPHNSSTVDIEIAVP